MEILYVKQLKGACSEHPLTSEGSLKPGFLNFAPPRAAEKSLLKNTLFWDSTRDSNSLALWEGEARRGALESAHLNRFPVEVTGRQGVLRLPLENAGLACS